MIHSSNSSQFFRHIVFWMFVFKVLFIRFRIGHLSLEIKIFMKNNYYYLFIINYTNLIINDK